MSLSEHEQRLLDEMERNLYRSEADVVDTEHVGMRPSSRSIVLGSLIALAGLAGLVFAVMIDQIWLGVVSFVVMFVGVLFALNPRGAKGEASDQSERPHRPRNDRPTSSLQDRLEQRWADRHGE